MKPYQKGPGLKPLILGSSIALLFPLAAAYRGMLGSDSPWTIVALALQVIPVLNLLRLVMRTSLSIRHDRSQTRWSWLMTLACAASAYWWIPRFSGLPLH